LRPRDQSVWDRDQYLYETETETKKVVSRPLRSRDLNIPGHSAKKDYFLKTAPHIITGQRSRGRRKNREEIEDLEERGCNFNLSKEQVQDSVGELHTAWLITDGKKDSAAKPGVLDPSVFSSGHRPICYWCIHVKNGSVVGPKTRGP